MLRDVAESSFRGAAFLYDKEGMMTEEADGWSRGYFHGCEAQEASPGTSDPLPTLSEGDLSAWLQLEAPHREENRPRTCDNYSKRETGPRP